MFEYFRHPVVPNVSYQAAVNAALHSQLVLTLYIWDEASRMHSMAAPLTHLAEQIYAQQGAMLGAENAAEANAPRLSTKQILQELLQMLAASQGNSYFISMMLDPTRPIIDEDIYLSDAAISLVASFLREHHAGLTATMAQKQAYQFLLLLRNLPNQFGTEPHAPNYLETSCYDLDPQHFIVPHAALLTEYHAIFWLEKGALQQSFNGFLVDLTFNNRLAPQYLPNMNAPQEMLTPARAARATMIPGSQEHQAAKRARVEGNGADNQNVDPQPNVRQRPTSAKQLIFFGGEAQGQNGGPVHPGQNLELRPPVGEQRQHIPLLPGLNHAR